MTADVAREDTPFTLVARTVERTTWPASALFSVYLVVVAPAMSTQPAPVEEQRCHWYEYAVGAAVHEPFDVVSVCLTASFPVTAGRLVLPAVGSQ
jgi:hypothetical protein